MSFFDMVKTEISKNDNADDHKRKEIDMQKPHNIPVNDIYHLEVFYGYKK